MIGLSNRTLWAAGTIISGIFAPMQARADNVTGPSAIPPAIFDIEFAEAGQRINKSTL